MNNNIFEINLKKLDSQRPFTNGECKDILEFNEPSYTVNLDKLSTGAKSNPKKRKVGINKGLYGDNYVENDNGTK